MSRKKSSRTRIPGKKSHAAKPSDPSRWGVLGLIPIDVAAQRLGVSSSTFRGMIRDGIFPATRIRKKKVMVHEQLLKEFVEKMLEEGRAKLAGGKT